MVKEYTDEELESVVIEAISFLDTIKKTLEEGEREFSQTDQYVIGLSVAIVEIWKRYKSSLDQKEKS